MQVHRYPISSNIDYSTLNISYFPIIIPLILDFMPSNLPFYRLNKSIIEVYKLETGNYQKPPEATVFPWFFLAKAHFLLWEPSLLENFTSLQDALLQPFLDHWHQRQQRCSGDLRDPTAHLRCGAAFGIVKIAMDPMWKTSGFNEENDPNKWIRFGWVFEELWMVILSQWT